MPANSFIQAYFNDITVFQCYVGETSVGCTKEDLLKLNDLF